MTPCVQVAHSSFLVQTVTIPKYNFGIDMQSEIYEKLVEMLEKKNTNVFSNLSNSFVDQYSILCPTFVHYLQTCHFSRTEK